MQNELNIEKSEFSPEVKLNASEGYLSISGRSMPENVGSFFDPIFEWIAAYVKNPRDTTTLEINFEYYNSSTARKITELIFELEELLENGKKVNVVWKHKSDDKIMKENGEEISSVVSLPFEILAAD